MTQLTMDRRTLLKGAAGAAAAVAAAPVLASCGSGSSAGDAPLTLWHLFSGADGVKFTQMLADVERQSPDLATQATCLAWGSPYYTKLAMASAGRRPPDAAVMHVSRLSGYAPGGLLETYDLTRLAGLGITKDTVPAALWQRCLYQGQLYSLPLDTHPFIAFYNLDVVEKAGLLTSDGKAPVITSTEQFLDVGRKLGEVTGKAGVSYGYVLDTAQAWRLFWGLYGQTGGAYQFDTGQPAQWDDDKAIQVVTFITTMLDGKVCLQGLDYQGAIAYFTSGSAGMFLSGEWEMPGLQKNVKRLGASPMPTMFGKPANYADSHSFVLPVRFTQDEARLQRTYALLTGLVKDALVWAQGGHIPAYLPVATSDAYLKLSPQAEYAAAAESVFLDPPVWFSGAGSNFQAQMSSHLQDAFLGRAKPSDAVTAMRNSITTMLSVPNPA